MKLSNINIILAFVFLSFNAVAQIDRTKAPEPGPAPKIQIGDYQSFTLPNGLKVFVVENHKIPRVAFSLTLNNKPVMEGEKAGYVSMTGQLLRNGTNNRTKAQLDEEIDFIGASLSTSASGMYAASLTKHKDKLLELMTDVLFNPSFPKDELEKIRKQTLSGLAASKDDPNAIASGVRSVMVYGEDHPYGELTTEESVNKVTLEDIKGYYSKYFKPNVGYLAVVGDINFKDAKKLVTKYFSSWDKGEIEQPTYQVPEAPEKTYVAMVDRPSSVQSVIYVSYPLNLEPGHPDVIKARVLNQILGGGFSSRLMQNLREDKAFTYGARSSLSSDDLVGNFTASASVRNEVTDSAVYEFLYELEKIKNGEVKESELNAAKASIIGSFARALERPSTVADFAINTARYNLPEDYYANYLKNVSNTTIADVKAMAEKYIKPDHSNVIVVGKASEIAEPLKRIGEIKYFDIYGKAYDPATKKALPEGLTSDQVLKDYIEALGGEERMNNVKSLKMTAKANMMGNELIVTSYKKGTSKVLMEVEMGGNVISKQLMNGDKVEVSQMGNPVPASEEMIEELKANAYLVSELGFGELGVSTKLVGVEKVGDGEAYAVEVVFPSGKKAVNYYDTKTKLKVKKTEVAQTPQGETTVSTEFKNYKEKDGILFPYTVVLPAAGMKMNMEVQEVLINPTLEDNKFN